MSSALYLHPALNRCWFFFSSANFCLIPLTTGAYLFSSAYEETQNRYLEALRAHEFNLYIPKFLTCHRFFVLATFTNPLSIGYFPALPVDGESQTLYSSLPRMHTSRSQALTLSQGHTLMSNTMLILILPQLLSQS
jgi:hypothetical protein